MTTEENRVKHDDRPNNLYALYDGIDTTPFGRSSPDRSEHSDEGWSAIPKRTIATDPPPDYDHDGFDPAPSQQSMDRRQRRPRGRNAIRGLWIAAALACGASFAAGSAILTPTPTTRRVTASAVAHAPGSAVREPHRTTLHPEPKPRASGAARKNRSRAPSRARHSSPSARPRRSARPVPTPVSTPMPAAPAQTTTVIATAPSSTHQQATSAPTSPSAGHGAAAPSPQPAGPTGQVALIGAGTSPSG